VPRLDNTTTKRFMDGKILTLDTQQREKNASLFQLFFVSFIFSFNMNCRWHVSRLDGTSSVSQPMVMRGIAP
jgi:hypothetical protein